MTLYEYTLLVLMFTVFNCVCCPSVINLFFRNSVHNFSTRSSSFNFHVYPYRINIRKNVVVNKGVSLWNSLPITNRKCSSINVFKKVIRYNILSFHN